MFERLQKKWKVKGLQLALILCTFAIGGSLTGYAARKFMTILTIEQKWLWVVIYIVLVTILWPIAVLLVSIFFGQFRFFTGYLKKVGRRMGIIRSQEMGVGSRESDPSNQKTISDFGPVPRLPTPDSGLPAHIAIFASGAGSNAQKIIDHFRNSTTVRISLIACNNPHAGVLDIAAKENIRVVMIEKEKFFRGDAYISELKMEQIDLIVLAGFLWKLPLSLIKAWPGRIINIHPALLPAHGGKGMYGNKVHEAVIAAGEKESGITIHYVDEHYDNGDIIFQAKIPVLPTDTPDSLALLIHKLEHEHYAVVIEKILSKLVGG
jgi:formyltetrahydrofolate-dependent phosphoribosylglycinamide formyltransferase